MEYHVDAIHHIGVYTEDMDHPLKQKRLDRGLTLPQAGALIGIAGESFRRYENGDRTPERDIMKRICREFGVQPNDFYEPFPPAAPQGGKEARAGP